jgi:hypothetical protein
MNYFETEDHHPELYRKGYLQDDYRTSKSRKELYSATADEDGKGRK